MDNLAAAVVDNVAAAVGDNEAAAVEDILAENYSLVVDRVSIEGEERHVDYWLDMRHYVDYLQDKQLDCCLLDKVACCCCLWGMELDYWSDRVPTEDVAADLDSIQLIDYLRTAVGYFVSLDMKAVLEMDMKAVEQEPKVSAVVEHWVKYQSMINFLDSHDVYC